MRDGNFYMFFRQYERAPNMSGYFMDLMADRVRMIALRVICKAYVDDAAQNRTQICETP